MSLEARGLVISRGGIRAVDGITLTIATVGWAGIVGANGSGKTSLLRGLAGRLPIDAGMILVESKDRTADRSWRARHLGFAPEISSLPPSLTGSELFSLLVPRWEEALAHPLEPLREALDFDRFLKQRIGALSAGMKQRLAIFSAFLAMPQMVILDEPFNWLDPVCAYDTKEALRALISDEGMALVTALHEIGTLAGYCDSGFLLSEGRISRTLATEDLDLGRRDYLAFEADIILGLRSPPTVG